MLAVVFYFYFFSDLDLRMFNKDKATQTDAQQTNQTGFCYETNANLDINSLIIEYYAALAVCDQDKLKPVSWVAVSTANLQPAALAAETHWSVFNWVGLKML